MYFLAWHYSKGLERFIDNWLYHLKWINHYFSLPLLIKTLFSPWKKLLVDDDVPGFSPTRYFENLMFNFISRGMGAIVRLSLFVVGILAIIFTFLASAVGIFLWIVFPPIGWSMYSRVSKSPRKVAEKISSQMNANSKMALDIFFLSDPGKFIVSHLGVSKEDFLKSSNKDISLNGIMAESIGEIVNILVARKVWSGDALRKIGIVSSDIVYCGLWWDKQHSYVSGGNSFGKPGIGLELLYGYTPTLNKNSIDLSTPRSYSHHLIGRESIVVRMERALNGGSSVVLKGSPGVGKRTVVLEFAHRASNGLLGKKMAYRRILEFDYNALLSSSADINAKKKELSFALKEAAYAGNIILMIRDLHRITNKEVEGFDFTDVFEDLFEKRELKIIAVTTPQEYEKYIVSNTRLRKYLEEVDVTEPNKDEAMKIMIEFATSIENSRDLVVTMPSMRKILDESDRFITEIPFPEKAIELLDAVSLYKESEGEGNVITVDDANIVLAEKTGVSFARLTQSEKKQLGNLEEIIHERLVNQDVAVNSIARSLRARTIGIAKEGKPLGSFLFLGPTGVGKTETAKVLAKVYFGDVESILRFDMAEYVGREGLERLIGSAQRNQPGSLTTAIKNKPASLLLLDELEKASPEIFNLFLSLLDEGTMTDAFDKKINGKNLFVIGTSNAGAEYIRQLVGQGIIGEELQKKVLDYVLKEKLFSPEFLNRFDAVVVYEPLTHEHLVRIAHIMLTEMARNLKKKGVALEVTSEAAEKVAKDGYDPAFGARPMQRVINLVIGDMLGKAILDEKIKDGDTIRVMPSAGKGGYTFELVK